ncbi:MAG TPA: DUF1330 domain-containing protein [Aestuariivirgaceae bacterium]
MAAYVIVDTRLIDAGAYEDYKVKARPIIEKFGGKYLARGGAMEVLEDELWRPSRMVVVEFADMSQALSCLRSAEYLAVRPIRHANAKSTVLVVEGLPS